MIATNHALAGAVIGATLPFEYAVPTALASHVVMDMLPHYSIEPIHRDGSVAYRRILITDIFLALTVALTIIITGTWQMFVVGLVAFSPDIFWIYLYYKFGRSFDVRHDNWFANFHHKIQMFERPWGIIVDIAFAVVLATVFISLL